MPRILIAECKQEVSTFNPTLSHYADFDVCPGEELLAYHAGGRLEVGGALSVLDAQDDVDIHPAYSARSRTSTGTLAAESFGRIAAEFLEAVRAAPPVDGIYYALHGAMAAEDEDDPEGLFLAETRRIVGQEVPIVISLDLHGVLTERMLRHSDAIVAFHTYPHDDFYETGVRAATLLLRIVRGEVRPVMARVRIPALVRGDELKTETGLLGRFIRQAQAVENSPGGLSAAVLIGNPFTDVPALASNSLVITDNDPERAQREAVSLAREFWRQRHRLQAPLVGIDQAIDIAAETVGTTIFTDAADAPSSGATGDSNAILHGLLAEGYRGRALLPIVDAPVVSAAMAAGVGGIVRSPIGGTLDPGRYAPVDVLGRVRLLSDGCYISEYNGLATHAGPTAVLEVGSITLVVTSRSVNLMDRSLFLAHGQDPTKYDLVVVKSPHCRHEYFEAWAARVINVDAPGSTSANLPSLGHIKCRRPIFPLDAEVSFEPEAVVYRRRA